MRCNEVSWIVKYIKSVESDNQCRNIFDRLLQKWIFSRLVVLVLIYLVGDLFCRNCSHIDIG